MNTAGVAPVVLAAGGSSRFGSDKLLAQLDGRPLLAHALETVRAAREAGVLERGVGVAPAFGGAVARLLGRSGLSVATASGGLSDSLRAGLVLLEHAYGPERCGAALIVLGDHPRLRLDVLETLVRAWRDGASPVVRPAYAAAPHVPGHPVLLDRELWELAGSATGDAGLRDVLGSARVPVRTVIVAGEDPDVDTPADLERIERGNACATS